MDANFWGWIGTVAIVVALAIPCALFMHSNGYGLSAYHGAAERRAEVLLYTAVALLALGVAILCIAALTLAASS